MTSSPRRPDSCRLKQPRARCGKCTFCLAVRTLRDADATRPVAHPEKLPPRIREALEHAVDETYGNYDLELRRACLEWLGRIP